MREAGPAVIDWRTRLRAIPAVKAAWMVGMAFYICVPYFGLQQGPWREPWSPPVTFLDRAVDFEPAWILPYLSVVLLVPLFPALCTRGRDVARYVVGVALLCLPCFLCFVLWPVAGPRPAETTGELHAWLVGVDRAWNSMPSLHAGLATYSGLFGWSLLGGQLAPVSRRLFGGVLLAWVGIILFSTLATKQHWVVDLPPAMLLAALAHERAGRWLPSEGLPAPSP